MQRIELKCSWKEEELWSLIQPLECALLAVALAGIVNGGV